jgi:hypothetical protein
MAIPCNPARQIAPLSIGMNRAQHIPEKAGLQLVGVMVTLIAAAGALSAQNSKESEMPPGELVRATAQNEVAAANNTSIKFMFQSRKRTPKITQKKIYVEGNEALASMIISENDQPLTPQQERAENDRLARLVNDPDRLRREQAHERQELEHTLRIVKALPDALCYEYAGTQSGETGLGKGGHQLVRLNFRPNPSYSPPSRVEQALEGMQGYVLIDTSAKRIARIEGTLFKDVTFGWGIFGRLERGGHFRIQQADAGGGNWAITEMSLEIKGTILLVKSLNVTWDEVFSDFRRLPDDLPFAQAVNLLQTEQGKLAQSVRSPQPLETSRNSQ